jgi:triacylglycerol lipase
MTDVEGVSPSVQPQRGKSKRNKQDEAEAAALAALGVFEAAKQKLEVAARALDTKIAELNETYKRETAPIETELLSISPLGIMKGKNPPTLRAAYSDRTSALMASLALLAYKRFEEANGRVLLETLLKAAGFQLLATFDQDSTQGYLAQNDDFAVVAFRGTTSDRDWAVNRDLLPGKARIPGHPRNVKVHGGFLAAFIPIEVDLRVSLHELTGDRPIYITGHSLGGALALVASAVLGGTQAGTNLVPLGDRIAAVYTFGAPRVGGRDFEECVKAPHYRVVNHSDLVPWMPPTWVFGYRHSGDVRILRRYGDWPAREQMPANLALTALWMLLLYGFGFAHWMRMRSHGIEDHEIARYVAKLDRIADLRGGWK